MSDDQDIDRRLRGIAESLELSSRNIHEMQERQAEYERQQKELDRRERRGREAILAGIARYFQIMNEPEQ